MIRRAALITAVAALTGCGVVGSVVGGAEDENIRPASELLPASLSSGSAIYSLLPAELSADLTDADARFAALSDAQIDELMVSVLLRTGCAIAATPEGQSAQYRVFGFSAYRSVGLDVDAYESWGDDDAANGAAWSDQKRFMGSRLHDRAGRSGTQPTLLTNDATGRVSGLTGGCGAAAPAVETSDS